MSCNGCRVLRKGCSENCILRPCIQWIETPEAQGHATVFVAKFFGRAGLMSFISAVPESQRPSLFQSLLFEAAGRTVNPVNGAVGLLWTGNWKLCQGAVETILRGGTLRPIPEFLTGTRSSPELDSSSSDEVTCTTMFNVQDSDLRSNSQKRQRGGFEPSTVLDLSLIPNFQAKGLVVQEKRRRPRTPSMNSEESVTTTCMDNGFGDHHEPGGRVPQLLSLFN